jgi:hypothetical protein
MDLQLPAYKLPGVTAVCDGRGSGRFAENAKVSAPCAFRNRGRLECSMRGPLARDRIRGSRPPGRLPDRIGEGQQVVRTRLRRICRHGQAQDFPAAGHRQRPGVLFAQIVTMRLRVRGQRAQHSGGVRVHVRQSCHR